MEDHRLPSNATQTNWPLPLQFLLTYFVLCLIVVIFSVIGNLLILGSFLCNKRLRKIRNYFILAMAVSDLFAGLSIPISFSIASRDLNELLCLGVTICPQLASTTVSLAMLLLAFIERYITIVYPLRYTNMISKTRAVGVIVIACVYCIFLSYLPLLGWNNIHTRPENSTLSAGECQFLHTLPGSYVALFQLGHMLPAIIIISILCIRILIVAFKQSRRIKAIVANPTPNPTSTILPSRPVKKGIVLHIVMLISLTLSLLPNSVLMTINYRFYTEEVFSVEDLVGGHMVMMILYLVAYSNCAINPWIYGLGNKELRMAIKSRCTRCIPDNREGITRIDSATDS